MKIERALYRAADVRELDRRAIDDHGIAASVLMERAGAALFRQLRERFAAAGRVLVVCGSGNNGGDGYVLARLAAAAGLQVTVAVIGEPGKLRGAAAEAAAAWHGDRHDFTPALLESADVVVDALLGTGLDRVVEGRYAEVIAALNACARPIIAADIPSGLNADTGRVMGTAVNASLTISFIGLKAGLFTAQGPEYSGEVVFAPLDVPTEVYRDIAPRALRLHSSQLREWLPRRARAAHKGDFGHVLLLGGGRGMPGAIRLAAAAALRGGAGKVSIAAWPGNITAVTAGRPEALCHGVENGPQLQTLLGKADVLAVGPGMGRDASADGSWAEEAWQTLSRDSQATLARVFDADALHWLARVPLSLNANDVITPHPGEAAVLLDCTVADIENDRFAAADALALKFGAVVVLKGAGSLIARPGGGIFLCDQGNPGMASGGMGDVLTGLIAAFMAQGLRAFEAASAGVLVHALAGDRAARAGERGLLAGDLIDEIRALVNPSEGANLG